MNPGQFNLLSTALASGPVSAHRPDLYHPCNGRPGTRRRGKLVIWMHWRGSPAGTIVNNRVPVFDQSWHEPARGDGEPMAQASADETAAFRAAELAGWQAKVAAYDRYLSPLTTEIGERLLDAAGVGRSSRVLDIACGPGRTTAAAAGRNASVVGVDFSERMIAYAASLFPAIEFRVADAESLPFADAEFDAVVVNFGVLHFSRPDCALVEACRVLRPGARLAFSLWAGPA
ncbi:MAG: class I SAM-dependent methyltransferase, partial [Dongiaceae bacterium]